VELTWTLPNVVAGVMVLSLNAYVLLGGADFGGGVWDLFARGKERDEQRAVIAEAIGPIWEANHVWLILVVVLLFGCFPRAFAVVATELHVPITLMLIGIVLRGSAFTFRTYDSKADTVQRRWGRIFSVASVATPVVLGMCLGAVASGAVTMNGSNADGFVARFITPWLGSPFAWSVGVFALVLFAYLAATYLTIEAPTYPMREIFRRRAMQSGVLLLVVASVTIAFAWREAPQLARGLTQGRVALGMHAVTAVAAVVALRALWSRHYQTAQIAAAAQASCILWGWAWSQFPWLLPPDQSITSLAAPRITLQLTIGILAVGTLILLPSFIYLFRIFKSGGTAFDGVQESPP
jgi:cytochrome d ubiquinol oxidase subunit II